MASTQEPGDVPGVNASGQGIQIGAGNNQYNAWMPKPPLDPAALGALNPHTAVARLQQLPHDELVDFFARASPDDVVEILGVFLHADLTKLVTTLADINRRKATELITAISTNLIDRLPEAAETIARKAAWLRWTDAGPLELFDAGYARRYKNGHIFWSREFGIRTTVGTIDDFCTANDLSWGFPTDDQKTIKSSSTLTDGILQKFEWGTVYSSKHGIYYVIAVSCHDDEEGVEGWLGFPTEEMKDNGDFGQLQKFERGTVYTYMKEGPESFAVTQEIADILPGDRQWRPISEEALAKSSSGKGQTVMRFEGEGESGTCETAVYWDEINKPVMVAPEVWDYYSKLGAEKSWLGFPVTEGILLAKRKGGGGQHFEAALIYWSPEFGVITVPKAAVEFIRSQDSLAGRLAFPVTEEQPVGANGSDRIQFFENGVVTVRDGKYEVWLRPESKTDPKPDPDPKRDSKPEPSVEPDTTAIPKGTRSLPLEDYDEMPVASLAIRMRGLSIEQVKQLIEYEKSHAARVEVIGMLENRIGALKYQGR